MKLDPKKAAFGRHETFSLRYSWLTKGFQQLQKDPEIFTSEDSTVKLGVGKNMVNAIRYWMQAARLIEHNNGKGFHPTDLGKAIFLARKGYDPYLEDEATIWLIHWLIASNAQFATAWFWFFNYFHKPEFESQEAVAALLDFVEQRLSGKYSTTTIKNDALVVLRMYSRSRGNTRTPLEDALDSPLTQLGLIKMASSGRIYTSKPEERADLPIGIFGFALAELFNVINVKELPIEDLMYSKSGYASPGTVFRFTENALLTKLETLIHSLPGIFEIRETAGIHQIYFINDVDPMHFLNYHYQNQSVGIAA